MTFLGARPLPGLQSPVSTLIVPEIFLGRGEKREGDTICLWKLINSGLSRGVNIDGPLFDFLL